MRFCAFTNKGGVIWSTFRIFKLLSWQYTLAARRILGYNWKADRRIGGRRTISGCSAVGSAGGLGPSGRRFDPCHSDQNFDRKQSLFSTFGHFLCLFRYFTATFEKRIFTITSSNVDWKFLFLRFLWVKKRWQIIRVPSLWCKSKLFDYLRLYRMYRKAPIYLLSEFWREWDLQ